MIRKVAIGLCAFVALSLCAFPLCSGPDEKPVARGALGGIPGGGFIPPTKIGTGGGGGDITAVTAGAGLTGGATTGGANVDVGAGLGIAVNANDVAIDPTYTQRRVSGTCTAGNAIRVIDQTGTVTCEAVGGGAGDITDVIAGAGLTGGAASGAATVDIGAGTNITVNANDVALSTNVVIGGFLNSTAGATSVGLFQGTILSPTSVTGTLNDWTPTSIGTATVIRVATSGVTTINGIGNGFAGRVLIITNISANTVNLANEAVASTTTTRILTGTAATVALAQDQSAGLVYDDTTGRWRVFSAPSVAATGDITDVTAGNGLTGGATSGAATLDVACSTGLTCNANDIAITSRDFGDITTTASGATWTIDNDVVTYAKMQNVSATSRFLGRITAAAGDVEEMTGTQATTLFDAFTSGLKGLAPASGGGTLNFLRSDGTWTVPPGTGPIRSTASLAANQNDWAPAGFASTTTVLDLTSVTAGPFNITGISSSGSTAGRVLIVQNNGGNTFTLTNESASSAAANRIKLTAGVMRTIGNYGSITITWDGTQWNETAESSRFTPELYSLGQLHVDGISDLIGAVTTYGATTFGDAITDVITFTGKVTSNVHFTGTTPTISCGGGSPTVTGNNTVGVIHVGDSGGAACGNCRVTFASPAFTTNAPICQLTPLGSTAHTVSPRICASATGTLDVQADTGKDINYTCFGRI